MSITFNADEILEMAITIEKNGAAFYRKAAEKAGASAEGMMLSLAAMEDDHGKTFTEMREKLSADDTKPTAFDPDDEGALYLQAMADGEVFDLKKDPTEVITGGDMKAVLRCAIGLEKDSIVFYLGIKKLVPEKLGVDWVDAIIAEEMSHIATLTKHLKELTA